MSVAHTPASAQAEYDAMDAVTNDYAAKSDEELLRKLERPRFSDFRDRDDLRAFMQEVRRRWRKSRGE